ncbi:TetR/AcrR family transcriptional regulator [Nonomuraea roseoviolacea]|uniref:AcrR family transcriptional regulator n=1 Tax=Nonomuraea roseoviolacea subsp. carminata TaxID=160689 RepID=A0ABT1K9Z9_9ACTN|nr:TetR/AcrR family transcriptional regulator [Nonomuraea roseoviolacea]MCP2350820.1 AcrR family transcriptional regulator [Nonomuraea roseoviolacea subsp. carminata]
MAPLDPVRERAILDATLELLSEMGYDRMSVDQIAKRARASKATIYRRWAGKPELVVDVICNRFDMDAPRPRDTGSLRGDLAELVRCLCETAERKHTLIMGLSSTLVSNQELARALRAHLPSRDLSGVEALLVRGENRGEPARRADTARLAAVAEALVWHRLIFVGPPLDDAFVVEAADDVLFPLVRAWAERPVEQS